VTSAYRDRDPELKEVADQNELIRRFLPPLLVETMKGGQPRAE
jgi:hypothetical protein